jgi:hypothetical protein
MLLIQRLPQQFLDRRLTAEIRLRAESGASSCPSL